jgi:amidohydrolase
MSAPSLQEKFVEPSLDLPWEQDIIALRRDFHEHPELGFEEVRTAAIVAERLRALGLEVRDEVAKTGVIGLLRGGQPGPTVLVRADMDALPIVEANSWQWRSSAIGKMHACGHDCHTATGLTVARLLTQEKDDLAGTVKFMFQPAEEGLGGAGRMIDAGVLDDPVPDYALALHVWSDIDVGKIAVKTGPVMASVDSFTARIIGQGGHGAIPQQTVDPIAVAAQVVLALQTVVSRNVKPLHPAVVTVGKLWAGSASNIIPNEALLEGTLRSFDDGVRQLLERRCRGIIEGLPGAFGASGEFLYHPGFPATVNDPRVTAWVRRAAESTLGAENVLGFEPTMGAEDMSLVLEKVPGCYFFVGGRNPLIDAVYPHHHPKFNVDERALEVATRAMVAAVKECLRSK